jgi:glutamine amidotransferase
MGWNTLHVRRRGGLLAGLEEESRFYFVHSYHVRCGNSEDVLASTEYGYEFASVVGRGSILGTQFHPEKSHRFGMAVIRNFVDLA